MLPVLAYARLLVVTAALAASAAAGQSPPPHHRPDGTFQNSHPGFQPRGLGDLLRWRLDAWREGLPKPAQTATPHVEPELAFLAENALAGRRMEPSITWIGHASVLVQLGGLNVLTDPVFSERASPFRFIGPKRVVAPGVALAELPHVDVVLISHNHYDHLDAASVTTLAAQRGGPPVYLVPLGHKAWFAERGIDSVVELDWWQSHRVDETEFVLTPVQHWSGRTLGDRMRALWGGWAMFAPDLHVFFSGDTGYSDDFGAIRERFADRQRHGGGFDLALLAIGGYEPRWFMAQHHVNPEEAVRIHLDLAAKRSLGIHWGTFALTDESLDVPPQQLAAARRVHGVADDDFFVIAVGETRKLARRPP